VFLPVAIKYNWINKRYATWVNPTGDWWWMKHPTSLLITKSLVDLIENLEQRKV
jgi:hypothetical protein